MPLVSACLLSYARPANMTRIVWRLRQIPWIDDIVIWDNSGRITKCFDPKEDCLTVVGSGRNVGVYGRYLATVHARHLRIYTQDDDCLVHNVEQLLDTLLSNPLRIAHGLRPSHYADPSTHRGQGDRDENYYGHMHDALLGWGAMYLRPWVDVLNAYIKVHGEDEILRRKADKIFTMLQRRRHNTLLAKTTDLPGAREPEALYRRSDHQSLTATAVLRCLRLAGGKGADSCTAS